MDQRLRAGGPRVGGGSSMRRGVGGADGGGRVAGSRGGRAGRRDWCGPGSEEGRGQRRRAGGRRKEEEEVEGAKRKEGRLGIWRLDSGDWEGRPRLRTCGRIEINRDPGVSHSPPITSSAQVRPPPARPAARPPASQPPAVSSRDPSHRPSTPRRRLSPRPRRRHPPSPPSPPPPPSVGAAPGASGVALRVSDSERRPDELGSNTAFAVTPPSPEASPLSHTPDYRTSRIRSSGSNHCLISRRRRFPHPDPGRLLRPSPPGSQFAPSSRRPRRPLFRPRRLPRRAHASARMRPCSPRSTGRARHCTPGARLRGRPQISRDRSQNAHPRDH